jgi:hypothetical protein
MLACSPVERGFTYLGIVIMHDVSLIIAGDGEVVEGDPTKPVRARCDGASAFLAAHRISHTWHSTSCRIVRCPMFPSIVASVVAVRQAAFPEDHPGLE